MGFIFLRYEAKELLLNKDWISTSKCLQPRDAVKSRPTRCPRQVPDLLTHPSHISHRPWTLDGHWICSTLETLATVAQACEKQPSILGG